MFFEISFTNWRSICADQTHWSIFEFFLKKPRNLPTTQMVCFFSYFPQVICPLISLWFFLEQTLEVPCGFCLGKSRPDSNIGWPNLGFVGFNLHSCQGLGHDCVRGHVSAGSRSHWGSHKGRSIHLAGHVCRSSCRRATGSSAAAVQFL